MILYSFCYKHLLISRFSSSSVKKQNGQRVINNGTYVLICVLIRSQPSFRGVAPKLTSQLFMSFGFKMFVIAVIMADNKNLPHPNESGFRSLGFNQWTCFICYLVVHFDQVLINCNFFIPVTLRRSFKSLKSQLVIRAMIFLVLFEIWGLPGGTPQCRIVKMVPSMQQRFSDLRRRSCPFLLARRISKRSYLKIIDFLFELSILLLK